MSTALTAEEVEIKRKKFLSLAEKTRLCADWKKSNLTKKEFAKINGINASLFSKWCARISLNNKSKNNKVVSNNWLAIKRPVEVVSNQINSKTEKQSLEIKIPNGMIITVSY